MAVSSVRRCRGLGAAMTILFILMPLAYPQTETHADWIKHPGNPVLGGALGTCFDVSVLRMDNTYRMYFSWRRRRASRSWKAGVV